MIRVKENVLFINNNRVELAYPIHKCIEYNGGAVVLFYDDAVISNNVEYYDALGEKKWSINDLLNIKNPQGNVGISLKDDAILCVISSAGVVFKIDLRNNKLVAKEYVK